VMHRYNVGGAVPSGGSIYVHRPQDENFLAGIVAGDWIELSGCRTMGKTSMVMRWRQPLLERGIAVAYADIAGHIGWRPAPSTLQEWIIKLARRLALDLDSSSAEIVSSLEKAQTDSPGELLELLLSRIQSAVKGRVLIVLDEIDVLRHLEYGEQIISTLRAIKTDGATNTALQQISFCFIGLQRISAIASERGGSSSQLGDIVELSDFDTDPRSVKEMAAGLTIPTPESERIVRRVLYYTGGQPLLTMQMLSDAVVRSIQSETEIDAVASKMLKEAAGGAAIHLFTQIENIIERFQEDVPLALKTDQASPAVVYNAYLNLIDGIRAARFPDARGAKVLLLSGLVRKAREDKIVEINGQPVKIESGELEIKGELFKAYFNRQWADSRLSSVARPQLVRSLRSSGERKRICVLNTGGTIGMVRRGGKVVPPKDEKEFRENYPELDKIAQIDVVQIDIVHLFNEDSINVYPSDWAAIAREIYKRRDKGYDGFVVAHGTDTMAYTASAVAFALGEQLQFPVVFTGAQATPDVIYGDAHVNLHRACKVALQRIPEVVIAFGTRVFRACRAQKSDDRNFEGFDTPNYYPLANITEEIEIRYDLLRKLPAVEGDILLREKFVDTVFLIQQYPGLRPEFFSDMRNKIVAGERPCDGIIIQTLGAGNVATRAPYSFIPFVTDAVRWGIPVCITSVYPPRPAGHTEYRTALAPLEAGAIYAGDMTAAAALTKFSWVLAQVQEDSAGADHPEVEMQLVREMMERNYIGERADSFESIDVLSAANFQKG
jgi:L-asparaginase